MVESMRLSIVKLLLTLFVINILIFFICKGFVIVSLEKMLEKIK
jgi:hypothetical protein